MGHRFKSVDGRGTNKDRTFLGSISGSIADRRVDGRFAVTTMDLGGEGSCLREVGGLRWFDTGDNFDLAMDRFTEAVQVGTSGSTTESGVLAALVAAAGDRECNAGFRRQGASLEFVL